MANSAPRNETNDSVGESKPDEKAEVKLTPPVFGPGSKVNWDDEKNDPNKRAHIGIDPTGKQNVRK